MQPFPHPNDASYKIWSTLANWPQRYSSFIWIMTEWQEWQNDRIPKGQGKSSIAPLFQSGAIKIHTCVNCAHCKKTFLLNKYHEMIDVNGEMHLAIKFMWPQCNFTCGSFLHKWANLQNVKIHKCVNFAYVKFIVRRHSYLTSIMKWQWLMLMEKYTWR